MRISDWSSDVCSSDLAWKTFAPADATARPRDQRARVEALEQQVATLKRSDQISRDANRDLQGTLAERDEEIAGLRADVAFYERFVGATGQRRGLTVHQLHLQPQSDQAWHFTTTLTQKDRKSTRLNSSH